MDITRQQGLGWAFIQNNIVLHINLAKSNPYAIWDHISKYYIRKIFTCYYGVKHKERPTDNFSQNLKSIWILLLIFLTAIQIKSDFSNYCYRSLSYLSTPNGNNRFFIGVAKK